MSPVNLPDLNYECVHCGLSCATFEVELDPLDAENVEKLGGPEAVTRSRDRLWLKKESCGTCHFFIDGQDGGCRIHKTQGLRAKPKPCQEFPFRAINTPGGVFVGASFACTAILGRHGPPIQESSVASTPLTFKEYPLAPGIAFDWETYLGWESRVLELFRTQGQVGLWSAGLEFSILALGGGLYQPTESMEDALQSVFRGLLALAEGPWDSESDDLFRFLQAQTERGTYQSRLLEGEPVEVDKLLARWEEPWTMWSEVAPFFEHLIFRKYLLEGPSVHARICSLPILAQLLQYLALSHHPDGSQTTDVHWALRQLETKLTFHARGLENYLERCSSAFLNNMVALDSAPITPDPESDFGYEP